MTNFRPDRRAARRMTQPAVWEALESRRLLSASPVVSSPASSLQTLLRALPNAVLPGSKGTANFSVSNSSLNPVNGKIRVTLLATTDGSIAGTVATVKTVTEPLHLLHAQTTLSFERFAIPFTYPSNLAAGRYVFIAVSNFDGAVLQTPAPSQGVLIAPPIVNLAATFGAAPTQMIVGRKPGSGLSLVINNTGNTPANGKVSINIFASPTPTLGSSPDLIETFSNIPVQIAANSGQVLSLTQPVIPLSTSTGDQYLIAVVNTNNTIPNASESIVTAVAPFTTSFTTGQFSSFPAAVTIGRSVPFSLLVANADGAPINGRVDINIYQSPTKSLNGSSTLLQTYSNQPINIPVNGSQTYSLNLNVPATAVQGNQFLIATLTPIAPLAATRSTDVTIVAPGITTFSA